VTGASSISPPLHSEPGAQATGAPRANPSNLPAQRAQPRPPGTGPRQVYHRRHRQHPPADVHHTRQDPTLVHTANLSMQPYPITLSPSHFLTFPLSTPPPPNHDQKKHPQTMQTQTAALAVPPLTSQPANICERINAFAVSDSRPRNTSICRTAPGLRHRVAADPRPTSTQSPCKPSLAFSPSHFLAFPLTLTLPRAPPHAESRHLSYHGRPVDAFSDVSLKQEENSPFARWVDIRCRTADIF
jgi:hypothetical protein